MKNNKYKNFVFIIIVIIIYFFVYKEFTQYKYAQKLYNNALKFDQYQRICVQVGDTFNYLYVTRTYTSGKAVVGAKYRVSDSNGKTIGEFQTNQKGNGGIIGLKNGKYYLQEIAVPNTNILNKDKYVFVVSDADNSFFLELTDKIEAEEEEEREEFEKL